MTKEQLERRRKRDFWVYLVLGLIGAIMTIYYAVYLFRTPEASTYEQGAFKENFKKSLPIALCLFMAQFITVAIAMKVSELNGWIVLVSYAAIIAVGAYIVWQKTMTGDPSFFLKLIMIAVIAIVIALVSLLLVLPLGIFVWLYTSIASSLLSTLLYTGIMVLLFSLGFTLMFTYFWIVIVILIVLVIVGIGLLLNPDEFVIEITIYRK